MTRSTKGTKQKYNRYMVFKWTQYDNVDPFGCVQFSSDDLEEAKAAEYEALGGDDQIDSDTGEPFYSACIFDRIEGVFIESKNN